MKISTVLLCGFGAFGMQHARAWQALGRTVLVADPDAKARERAQSFGIAETDSAVSAQELLDRADCIDIVTPPALHIDLCKLALNAAKPVLLEKPAVLSTADAEQLVAMQKQSGQPVQVNLLLRAHPMTKQAKALLEKGAIGSPILMEGRFRGWKRQHRAVGLLYNDGVHFLDLMRFFADSPIASVAARALCIHNHANPDDITMDITHANGAQGRLALGLLVPGSGQDSFVHGAQTEKILHLVGDRGSLTLDFNANTLKLRSVAFEADEEKIAMIPGIPHQHDFTDTTPLTLLQDSFRAFLASCETAAPPLVPLDQGALELARVIDAVPLAAQLHAASRLLIKEGAS